MKTASLLACVTVLLLGAGFQAGAATSEEGVALAIIYDTSGSMSQPVGNSSGGQSPKYIIANRALIAVARQIEAYATNSVSGHKVQCCLLTFQGEGARQSIPMGPFSAATLVQWAGQVNRPGGNTPLGNALEAAGKAVLGSPLSRKHILVITDGENTAGPGPERVMPLIKQQAGQKGAAVSVHFIGFDVDVRVFAPLKKQGATVVSARDEKQLASQLEFILQKKILLEDEDPQPNK